MASSSANKAMKKTNQDPRPPPAPHHQQPLNCPRCDSSNTKFCYYNNYSLSQPRHFCKACKRYWTRGGTLRNVPVGGGCRKNKRPKRQSSSGGDGASSATSATSAATANHSAQSQIDLPQASNRMHNPLLYSPLEPNFPFSSFGSTRVSSDTTGFDLHSQMNGLGLGFSSELVANEVINNDYGNGFKPIQDSSPFLAAGNSNNNIFFGSSNFASTSTMASLLASSLHQNPIEQINSSDPSSLLWNTTNVGAWFDPSNMGSSVPSLI